MQAELSLRIVRRYLEKACWFRSQNSIPSSGLALRRIYATNCSASPIHGGRIAPLQ